MLAAGQNISINQIAGRGAISVQNPTAVNGFTGSIYFDDIHYAEAEWYALDMTYQAAVPIPAALWLLGSALGVLGWIRRR